MSEQQLNEWIDTIPGYEDLTCNCQKGIYRHIEANPPRFNDWQRWTWEIHNAVNFKLGKPEIDWGEACQQWNWNPNKEAENANTEDSS